MSYWQVSFFVVILMLSVSMVSSSFAYSERTSWGVIILSPRLQIHNGTHPEYVTCWKNLALMKNSQTNSIACVKVSTGEKLLERGWELIDNPNTLGYVSGGFLHVMRDLNTTSYQYVSISPNKLSSYPDVIYALSVADLDYDNYLLWAKKTQCYLPTCSKPYSPIEYANNIDNNEAKKIIIDFGFQDYPKMPEETKSYGHKLHMESNGKYYRIDIVGVGT